MGFFSLFTIDDHKMKRPTHNFKQCPRKSSSRREKDEYKQNAMLNCLSHRGQKQLKKTTLSVHRDGSDSHTKNICHKKIAKAPCRSDAANEMLISSKASIKSQKIFAEADYPVSQDRNLH